MDPFAMKVLELGTKKSLNIAIDKIIETIATYQTDKNIYMLQCILDGVSKDKKTIEDLPNLINSDKNVKETITYCIRKNGEISDLYILTKLIKINIEYIKLSKSPDIFYKSYLSLLSSITSEELGLLEAILKYVRNGFNHYEQGWEHVVLSDNYQNDACAITYRFPHGSHLNTLCDYYFDLHKDLSSNHRYNLFSAMRENGIHSSMSLHSGEIEFIAIKWETFRLLNYYLNNIEEVGFEHEKCISLAHQKNFFKNINILSKTDRLLLTKDQTRILFGPWINEGNLNWIHTWAENNEFIVELINPKQIQIKLK